METDDELSSTSANKANYTIGDYILQERFGGGEYSSTFKGINRVTQEIVAVKVFPKSSSISKELYESEIKALNALRDISGILQLKDEGANSEYYFIVTEFVQEGSLRSIFKSYPESMNIEDVIQLFTPIADAIDRIHDKNIIHRDLKPENILIRKIGKGHEIFITDFGVVKFTTASKQFQTETTAGTSWYIAPEALRADPQFPQTKAVDIYALGVMLYEALEGRTPFRDINDVFSNKPALSPTRTIQNSNALVVEYLLRIMNNDPEQRPRSAREAVEGIRNASAENLSVEQKWIGRKFRNYIVEEVLGAGAMGISLRARDTRTNAQVVLKAFVRSLSGNALQAYDKEIKSLNRLEHGHGVLTPRDRFEYEGTLFTVTDYQSGGSLRNLLSRRPKLDTSEVLEIFAQIAEAIDYIHDKKVVHRDIKPENIVYNKNEGKVNTFITDFGVSILLASTQSSFMTHEIGTPRYMAPELWDPNARGTKAVDIYGFGIMLYEALEGHAPFEATSPSIIKQHLSQSVPPPEKTLKELGANARDILLQALAKDPEERPKTATEIMQQIRGQHAMFLGQKYGKYTIEKFVGRGTYGATYRSYDKSRNQRRKFAFKVLSIPEPLMHEIEPLKKLGHHEGIVPVLDSNSEKGIHYIVMEYINGDNLREKLQSNRMGMDLDEILKVFKPVARALDFLHANDIVHGDLKPENIILYKSKNEENSLEPIITGYGISKIAGKVQSFHSKSNSSYIAPELWEDGEPSPASDIYAFGVMLYECLEGTVPFDAKSLAAIMRQHLDARPPIPKNLLTSYGKDAVNVLLQSLDKKAERRQRSAVELVSRLEDVTRNRTSASSGRISVSGALITSLRPIINAGRKKIEISISRLLTLIAVLMAIFAFAFYQGARSIFAPSTITPRPPISTESPTLVPPTITPSFTPTYTPSSPPASATLTPSITPTFTPSSLPATSSTASIAPTVTETQSPPIVFPAIDASPVFFIITSLIAIFVFVLATTRGNFSSFRDAFYGRFRRRIQPSNPGTETEAVTISQEPPLKELHAKGTSAYRLRSDYEYRHSPISFADDDPDENKKQLEYFVGREKDLTDFANHLTRSRKGGAFLVTGYRGVGKTSFVNRAVFEYKLKHNLEKPQPEEVVDIPIKLANDTLPTDLMIMIIQGLYDHLNEKEILEKLPRNFRSEIQEVYERTKMSISYRDNRLADAEFSIGNPAVSAKTKSGSEKEVSKAFAPINVQQAEQILFSISRKLGKGYSVSQKEGLTGKATTFVAIKIIIIFDELDKLEEEKQSNGRTAIEGILGALKNLFTASGIIFIFIGGKDLHDRWVKDKSRGESILDSVFSHPQYLSPMWSRSADICDGFLQDPGKKSELSDFKMFLEFKGHGLPRQILSVFQDFVIWENETPYLRINKAQKRQIRFYAGLLKHLEDENMTNLPDSHDESHAHKNDKYKLGVFHLIDWILDRGNLPFSANEAIEYANALDTRISPDEGTVTKMVDRLLRMLENYDYVEPMQKSVFETQTLFGSAEETIPQYRVNPHKLSEIGYEEQGLEQENKFEHYRSLKLISQNNLANIYRAWDEINQLTVVVKRLRSSIPIHKRRLLMEGKILSSLDHPNLVKCRGFDGNTKPPYIALDYVDGVWLKELMPIGGFHYAEALSIFIPIVDVVKYLHKNGIVRCDIKPSSIRLSSDGKVLLVDLSTAKSLDNNNTTGLMTETGMLVGTLPYIAPEQLRGQEPDRRSDVFSLGILLVQLCTGNLPFMGNSKDELINSHKKISTSKLSTLLNKLPEDLKTIILGCLKAEPNNRYNSDELLIALSKFEIPDLRNLTEKLLGQTKAAHRQTHIVKPSDAAVAQKGLSVSKTEEVYPRPCLGVKTPGQEENFFPLKKDFAKLLVGRSKDSDLSLSSQLVSHYHAVLLQKDRKITLEDLNTPNGTYVNGELIREQKVLENNDVISIADVTIRFFS